MLTYATLAYICHIADDDLWMCARYLNNYTGKVPAFPVEEVHEYTCTLHSCTRNT